MYSTSAIYHPCEYHKLFRNLLYKTPLLKMWASSWSFGKFFQHIVPFIGVFGTCSE